MKDSAVRGRARRLLAGAKPAAEASGAAAHHDVLASTIDELRATLSALEERSHRLLATCRTAEQERDHYRLLFDLVPDASLVTTAQGAVREANQAAVELFGLFRGWSLSINQPLVTYVAPEDRAGFWDRLGELRTTGRITGWRLRLKTRRGISPAEVTVVADRRQPESGLMLRWLIRDLSHLEDAAAAVRENERRFRTVFESSLDCIAVNWLDDGAYLDVNREFLRMSGFARGEVIGRTPRELGFWGDDDEFRDMLRDLHTLGEIRSRPARFRMKDGRTVLALYSAVVVELGNRRCVVSFTRDVTEHQHTLDELNELRLQGQEKSRLAEIGAMAARLVHDLGTPISGILLHAEVARRRARSLETAQRGELAVEIEEMAEEARRLDRMTAALKDFSRQRRLELAPVALPALLAAVQHTWGRRARRHGISLEIRADGGLPAVVLDELQMSRVLDNLVKNAIEAVDMRGTVTVSASAPENGRIRITVADDGAGIPEGYDPFALFQTTKPEGTGLGLAIAHEIVEAHGGTVAFERRSPRGTAFHVDLPVSPAAVGGPSH